MSKQGASIRTFRRDWEGGQASSSSVDLPTTVNNAMEHTPLTSSFRKVEQKDGSCVREEELQEKKRKGLLLKAAAMYINQNARTISTMVPGMQSTNAAQDEISWSDVTDEFDEADSESDASEAESIPDEDEGSSSEEENSSEEEEEEEEESCTARSSTSGYNDPDTIRPKERSHLGSSVLSSAA
eukprot:3371101-Rhodomonas_salina.1